MKLGKRKFAAKYGIGKMFSSSAADNYLFVRRTEKGVVQVLFFHGCIGEAIKAIRKNSRVLYLSRKARQ